MVKALYLEIYEGLDLITTGTVKECAEKLGVSKPIIYKYIKNTKQGNDTNRNAIKLEYDHEFAIYKGDKFLFIDTVGNCAKRLGVDESTVYFYSTPANAKRGNDGERITSVKLGRVLNG